jgi:hypothetical protein
LESDSSEEDSSGEPHSDHDEEGAESDNEQGVMQIETEMDNGREVQDSGYGGE